MKLRALFLGSRKNRKTAFLPHPRPKRNNYLTSIFSSFLLFRRTGSGRAKRWRKPPRRTMTSYSFCPVPRGLSFSCKITSTNAFDRFFSKLFRKIGRFLCPRQNRKCSPFYYFIGYCFGICQWHLRLWEEREREAGGEWISSNCQFEICVSLILKTKKLTIFLIACFKAKKVFNSLFLYFSIISGMS